jgi:molybdopterin synthase sulfur carrier subunit
MVRVVLPFHLRTLARITGEIELDVRSPVTQNSVIDAIEAAYPMLRGTIRDHHTRQRRPLVRFFACQEDISYDAPDTPLAEAIVSGKEALLIVGALAGG